MVNTKSPTGFTIVELLIVIVVIAILAAITIVSYSGIQQRAYNSRTVAAVAQAQQAIISYYTVHNAYPPHSGDNNNVCLGQGYTDQKCGSIAYSGCGISSQGVISEDSQFNSAVSEFLKSPLPAIAHPDMVATTSLWSGCTATVTYNAPTYLSATYISVNSQGSEAVVGIGTGSGQAYQINYYLQGNDADCGPGDQAGNVAGWTACKIRAGDIRHT